IDRHLFVLATIRYNWLSVEHVRGLSKRQIIGYLVEVPMGFLLPHSDGREQESFSCYLHTHVSQVPMAWDNLGLPDLKVASLVQVPEQAESEFHVPCEMTTKRSQSLLFAVHPHLAFHVVGHAGLHRRRVEIRVWYKAQLYHVPVITCVAEYERIRQHLEQPSAL